MTLEEKLAYELYKYAKGYKYNLEVRDYLNMARTIINELGIIEYDFPAPIIEKENKFVKVYRIVSMEH